MAKARRAQKARAANAIARVRTGGQLTQFDPERHRLTVAALNYGIAEAKRIKDWPALEKAVDDKIEEQHAFAGWWREEIRRPGGDQKSKTQNGVNGRGQK